MILTVKTYDNDMLGTISDEGGKLASSDPSLQEIADSALYAAGGDVAAAMKRLDGYQNGYIFISSGQDAVAG